MPAESGGLEHLDDVVRICVVCAGNICRSPMAEAVLRDRIARAGLADQVVVDSAGTGAWHAGELADPRARRTLREHGYSGDAHRARQFRADWFDRYDLVLVADRDNFADISRIAPDAAAAEKVQMLRAYDAEAVEREVLDVPDPYYGAHADFEDVLLVVERAADGLVATLTDELTG